MECWSIGNYNEYLMFLIFFITPVLHHSNTPMMVMQDKSI